jgi:hypothetical protein
MTCIIKLDNATGGPCCIRKADISVITVEDRYTVIYTVGGTRVEIIQDILTVLEIMGWKA